jgi:hypothetical protein
MPRQFLLNMKGILLLMDILCLCDLSYIVLQRSFGIMHYTLSVTHDRACIKETIYSGKNIWYGPNYIHE